MWQPPGGLPGPPERNDQIEVTTPEQTPLNTSHTSPRHSNSEPTRSRGLLYNASGTRGTRGVIQRKRRLGRPDSDRVNPGLRQGNTSQNNISRHGSSWVLTHRRCSHQPSRRHFRMANLYDIQYSSSNLLNSIPNEVMTSVNNEDATHRLLSKGHPHETVSNQSSNERPSDNDDRWRLSNPNEDFNVISSLSRPQLLTAGITQCSSESSAESVSDLFNTSMNDTTSISNYSSSISNNTLSCSNSPTAVDNFSITESIKSTVNPGIIVNPDSLNSDTISTGMTTAKLYDSERSFSKTHDGGVLLELHKLNGPSNLNLPPSTVQARKVANRVVAHTRIFKTPDERFILCLNCDAVPTLPVTGQCGHTRCFKCVKRNDTCPCGSLAPSSPCVNTVVQAIIDKMLQDESGTRISFNSVVSANKANRRKHTTPSYASNRVYTRPCPRLLRSATGFVSTKKHYSTVGTYEARMPMTSQGRLKRARELLACGQYYAAAPHLARAAASSAPVAQIARSLLAQAISALSQNRDPRRFTRELYTAVRQQSAVSWLKPSDLECVLCYHTYTSPVTTPCGHTYCRTCIERSLDYRKTCALCLRPLDDFSLAATRETEFVIAALAAIDAVSLPSPLDPDVIPIFVCTVAFPSIPCPLFIFDPRYWLMIRRILESGSRKFGMVAYERDRSYSDYGTVLEVCDCVHLEDGRSILSTVGVSRFRVIKRDVRDGCDVARIQPLVDVSPNVNAIWQLRVMAAQITYKTFVWLESMNRAVRAEIEAAFGAMPRFHTNEEWWERADGPQWLWWLIAILPLRSEIKILILSTRSLLKRMMAVTRTLEFMDSVAFTNNSNTECDHSTALSSTEDWLERNA